jgi:hypothetical protein
MSHKGSDVNVQKKPPATSQERSEIIVSMQRSSSFSRAELTGFVETWFKLLSERAEVGTLEKMLAPQGLEMVFPERRLLDYSEFEDWYRDVGKNFGDQQHILQSLDVTDTEGGADLSIVVIWKARQLADGKDVAFRATQAWTVSRSPDRESPLIVTYRVLALDPLEES